jgi:[ribosomal protein S18]-alanine N-acetyltransferase
MARVTPYGPLRRARSDDVPRLLELEGLLFDNSLAEPMLLRELELGQCFVYDVMGDIIGYALLREDGDKYDLTRLGVDPASQGSGIGRVLLRHVISLGKTVVLSVRKKNYGALRLYRRHGFEIVGQLTAHEAWVMRRDAGDALRASRRGGGVP